MEETKPSRPKRIKHQPPVLDESEKAVPTPMENKYAPRTKIGKATIGVPNRVERVGLGNLTVITTNGYTDLRPNGDS